MIKIRIACWNIQEGRKNGDLDQLLCLNKIANELSSVNADVVLLNEIMRWNFFSYGGIDQSRWLASKNSYNFRSVPAAEVFKTLGAKHVAVLSKFDIGEAVRIIHSSDWFGINSYSTIHTTAIISDVKHNIFSTRFNAYDVKENITSHLTIAEIIANIPDSEAVIFGGDLNTKALGQLDWPGVRAVDYNEFLGKTRLTHVIGTPWTSDSSETGVDHLFYRAPSNFAVEIERYEVISTEVSDHPLLFAELSISPNNPENANSLPWLSLLC